MAFSAPSMQISTTLLKACVRGDHRSQLQLYDLCYSYMMSICIRYTINQQDAGARLNAAFLKVLQNLGTYDPAGSFKGWISKITVRTIIDDYRQKQRHEAKYTYTGHELNDDDWMHYDWKTENQTPDIDYIMQLINQLPGTTREVFNLFIFDGYTHKEIGVMLEMTENTSKWHVHEAKRRLRETLSPIRKREVLK